MYAISQLAILLFLMGIDLPGLIMILAIFYIPSFFLLRKFFRKKTRTQQHAVSLALVISFFVAIAMIILTGVMIYIGFSLYE